MVLLPAAKALDGRRYHRLDAVDHPKQPPELLRRPLRLRPGRSVAHRIGLGVLPRHPVRGTEIPPNAFKRFEASTTDAGSLPRGVERTAQPDQIADRFEREMAAVREHATALPLARPSGKGSRGPIGLILDLLVELGGNCAISPPAPVPAKSEPHRDANQRHRVHEP